jgi:hypothetical protein
MYVLRYITLNAMKKHRSKMIGGVAFLIILGSVCFLTVHGQTTFSLRRPAERPAIHFELKLNFGLAELRLEPSRLKSRLGSASLGV